MDNVSGVNFLYVMHYVYILWSTNTYTHVPCILLLSNNKAADDWCEECPPKSHGLYIAVFIVGRLGFNSYSRWLLRGSRNVSIAETSLLNSPSFFFVLC